MVNLFLLIIFLISVYGVSIISNKLFFLNQKNTLLEDFFSGIYLIILISLIFNFFFPLKFLNYFIIIFGTFLFLINFKNLNFNFFSIILIISILYYISLSNGLAVDSKTYHLQIIEKFNSNKIIFGFSNLDFKYGNVSIWHLMLSTFYYDFNKIQIINYISITLFSILIYECFRKINDIKIESLFLIFCVFYLILYSIIHPSGNGTILTLMGSPDTDFPGMILFIISIYFYLLSFQNPKIKKYLLVVSTICFLTKLSYIASVLLILRYIQLDKKFFKNRLFISVSFLILLWSIRNIIISGCAIYPLTLSCFNFLSWNNIEEVKLLNQILTSYARDTGPRENFMDFEYTLYSFEWFMPWLKFYFLKNSLIQSILILISINFTIFFIKKIKKQKINYPKNLNFVIFLLLISLIIWMKALDTRYILGVLVSLVSILSILIFINLNFLQKIRKYFSFILITLLLLLIFKNFNNYKHIDLINKKFVENNETELINESYNITRPSNNSFCLDVKEFCIYNVKDLKILKKNSYFFIYNNK